MNLPEKKAAVFRAVLKLLRQGRPLGDLKVSEIAEAAGIGKGTVYEYFPSREELLRNIPFEDMVFAGENALDLRTLVRDQSAEAALAAHEMGAADAPSRMIGFIPEQTGLVKRTIGFLLFDRETFRKKLRKRMKRMSNEQ